MSDRAIEREFRDACARALEVAPAPRARRPRASVSTGDGSRSNERGPGSGRASRDDAEVDAYVARVRAHGLARRCVDAMTHAQRWADASEALEVLEIDLAWRVESAFEAARKGTRDLEDALVDAKSTPDAFAAFTPRGAVERARESRVAWNERIALAAAEAETERKNSEAATEGDGGVEDADAGCERDDEVENVNATRVETSSDVASPVRAREFSSEEAVVKIQAAFRGHASRAKTNADARLELEHLGMLTRNQSSNEDSDAASERKRRSERRERSEKALSALAAKIRAELLASRRESIKRDIKASLEAEETGDDAEKVMNATDAKQPSKNQIDAKNPEHIVADEDEDFHAEFSRAFDRYTRRWGDEPSARLNAFDVDDVQTTVLSEVTNSLKVEVEEEMRALESEKKKVKTAAKKKKKAPSAKTTAASTTTAKKATPKKTKTKKSKKNAVDAQTIDPKVFADLVRAEMIEMTPLDARLDDYLGAGGERRGDDDDDDDASSTMLDIYQLRHILAVSVTTPLTSKRVHELAPHLKCVLLEGRGMNGKSYLARLCAAEAGCALYNLSPDRIARAEARGDNAKSLLKSVFQAAKVSAPSVVFIRDVDLYFPGAGKKSKSADGDAARKLRKDLLKEIKLLKPGSRVTVLCTRTVKSLKSSIADPKGFDKMFDARLRVPAPDYGGRRLIVRRAFERAASSSLHSSHAASHRRTGDEANATLVCHATEGMTAGALFALVRDADAARDADRLRALLRRARDATSSSRE